MLKAIIFDLGNTLISQDDGHVFPNTIQVLTQLKNKYKLALISNVPPTITTKKIHDLLKEAELFDFFDVILISSEVGINKPEPRIFEIVLDELKVKSEETVMVGNTISTDIVGGNGVGMKTVLIQPEQEHRRREYETPDHIIYSLKELLNLTSLQASPGTPRARAQ